MSYLLTYSGIIASLTAVFLILLPTLFVGLNYKDEPISFVVRRGSVGLLFKCGLIVTAVFLSCNTLGLVIRFQLTQNFLGVILYCLGTLCMILVALVDIDTSEALHTIFAKGYFLLTTLGSILISVATSGHFVSIQMILALVGGWGTLLLYKRAGLQALSEYWGIIFSILWVLSYYFV